MCDFVFDEKWHEKWHVCVNSAKKLCDPMAIRLRIRPFHPRAWHVGIRNSKENSAFEIVSSSNSFTSASISHANNLEAVNASEVQLNGKMCTHIDITTNQPSAAGRSAAGVLREAVEIEIEAGAAAAEELAAEAEVFRTELALTPTAAAAPPAVCIVAVCAVCAGLGMAKADADVVAEANADDDVDGEANADAE